MQSIVQDYLVVLCIVSSYLLSLATRNLTYSDGGFGINIYRWCGLQELGNEQAHTYLHSCSPKVAHLYSGVEQSDCLVTELPIPVSDVRTCLSAALGIHKSIH